VPDRQQLELRGERLVLRPVREDDLPALAAVIAEPEVVRWWGPHDLERLRDELLVDPRVEALTIELDGRIAGILEIVEEADPDYRHAGLDIALTSSLHDQGLGREALGLAIDHLVSVRGHHRFTIDPAVGNARAIACYTAVGFEPVGVMHECERGPDGRWHDCLLMELIAAEPAA
jgi:aminoglycoside 6'-N-acetyltransferase